MLAISVLSLRKSPYMGFFLYIFIKKHIKKKESGGFMKYEIRGEPLPVVICYLEEREKMITEQGAMAWMTPNMKMETNTNGIGRAFARTFSGESFFQNIYYPNRGDGMIAFTSSFPGTILAFEIEEGVEIIAQKKAFLAATEGVRLSTVFNKKLGTGLFGGEGFIMQRLSGNGTAFVEIDGSVVEYDLGIGDSMIIDTGYLAAMSGSCQLKVETVPGVKNKFFGGEGFFNTVVTGPGHIWIQTMPAVKMAGALRPYITTGN